MGHGQGVSNMRAGNSCKASDIDALVTVPDRPLWCFVEDRRYGASQPSAYLENKLDKRRDRFNALPYLTVANGKNNANGSCVRGWKPKWP
ncbi:hypothetical protein BVIET440_50205 [Burkholderia vietnamiensis]